MFAEGFTCPIGYSITAVAAPKAFVTQMMTVWSMSQSVGAALNMILVNFYKQGNIRQIIKICEVPAGESVRTICEVEDYLWINYKDGIYRIKESAMEVQEPTFISSALQ